MTRASFTGAFDESCIYYQQTPTLPEENGTNHCFTGETITGKRSVLVFVDTEDQSSEKQGSKSEPVVADSTGPRWAREILTVAAVTHSVVRHSEVVVQWAKKREKGLVYSKL